MIKNIKDYIFKERLKQIDNLEYNILENSVKEEYKEDVGNCERLLNELIIQEKVYKIKNS